MPNSSSFLSAAKTNKADKFYTQIEDVNNEVSHYKDQFSGKIVYCNCDAEWSAFYRFFRMHYNEYGLRGLMASSFSNNGQGIFLSYDGNKEEKHLMDGNGSFDCPESLKLLDVCDIVCTNPPFSLFNKFIDTVINHGKKLLVIGNQNAMTNNNIFNLFKEGKLWAGYGFKGDAAYFINQHYKDFAASGNHKEGMIRVSGVMWFTNMKTDKQNEKIETGKKYSEGEYRKYDDYDAINVDSIKDIPDDYYEPIGVPITYLKKHNPEQFDILGIDKDFKDNGRSGRFKMDGKNKYARAVIKRKQEDNPLTNDYKDMIDRWDKLER